ncbi:MAG: hypothetical protein IKU37_09675 [Candidatus Gastranaerophilales bacterium]|nr:hypothetical protein [Candidatus Gastranaerophilales bacterium]
MNISPIVLNNYLAIKKQNIKNYQTQPNFKSLNCDTISFSGETGLNFAERMASIAKYQKLSQILNEPSSKTAQECIDSLKDLQDDKDCPADLKSEILLGQGKQAMNKVIKLYMGTRYADEKTSLFNLIEAMISASPNKKTTLAQFTTEDENGRIPIQIAYSDKKMAERIYKCFEGDSETLSVLRNAVDEAKADREFAKYHDLRCHFFPKGRRAIENDFIQYLKNLIKPRENPDEPIIIRDQKARDSIVKFAISANLPAEYFGYSEKNRREGYKETLKAIADLATPEEKRALFLNRNLFYVCSYSEDIMFAWSIFKDDMEAKNELCRIISSLTNWKRDVCLDTLSAEHMLSIINEVGPEARKTLLLATDKLDLLPISYADKKTQIEFLKASPDDETREKQLLALPKLTEEALELVPEEKREEIETKHKEKHQKRKNSLYETPNTIYNMINNASESYRSKIILKIAGILADDHNQLRGFLFNCVNFKHSGFVVFGHGQYVPGLPINTLNENHKCKILDLVLPDEDLFFKIFREVDFEVLKEQAYKYCQKAPSDEAILKILKHEKKKEPLTCMQDRLEYTCLAGNLTPEQTLDVFGLLKDKNSKIKFLLLEYENCEHKLDSVWGVGSRGKGVVGRYTTSSMGYTYRHEIYIKETGTEYRTQSTKEVFEKLISQDSSYLGRVIDIILNLALDKEVADEEVRKLLNAYVPMLSNEDNALEFFSKIFEIVNSNNDKEQIRRLLENIKANVSEICKKEIDDLIEKLD